MTNKIKVTTKTLDQVIPSDFKYNMIVLDVEGAELEVLKGCSNLPKYIQVELNHHRFKDSPHASDVIRWLNAKGYEAINSTLLKHLHNDVLFEK